MLGIEVINFDFFGNEVLVVLLDEFPRVKVDYPAGNYFLFGLADLKLFVEQVPTSHQNYIRVKLIVLGTLLTPPSLFWLAPTGLNERFVCGERLLIACFCCACF